MKITINHPNQQSIEFAHKYLDEERDEIPNAFQSMPSRLIGVVDAEKIRNGEYDNTEYDIDLNEFKWMHYFILKRLLERIQETKRISIRQMSNEVGLNPASYHNLFKTRASPSRYKQSFIPGKGGKKRSVRRSRRRVRRTHRRRARRTHRRRA